jgi:hypothetical protein
MGGMSYSKMMKIITQTMDTASSSAAASGTAAAQLGSIQQDQTKRQGDLTKQAQGMLYDKSQRWMDLAGSNIGPFIPDSLRNSGATVDGGQQSAAVLSSMQSAFQGQSQVTSRNSQMETGQYSQLSSTATNIAKPLADALSDILKSLG